MTGQANSSERPVGEELLDRSARNFGLELIAGSDQRLQVLIADHDGLARCMVRTALGEANRIAIVLTAGDGREALELARYYRPSVVIIDTALPPAGGVELIRELLLAAPETRILTVSVDDQQTALAALRAGAVGHIDKNTDPGSSRAWSCGLPTARRSSPKRLLMPLLELLRDVPDAGWRPLHSRLTTREWQIVDLLADGASTERIAERFVLAQTTVYSHVNSVLRKLGVHSRRDAVAAAELLRHEEARLREKSSFGLGDVHQPLEATPVKLCWLLGDSDGVRAAAQHPTTHHRRRDAAVTASANS